jgi:hypothetical protein
MEDAQRVWGVVTSGAVSSFKFRMGVGWLMNAFQEDFDERNQQGLKPVILCIFSAWLKPCPDTKLDRRRQQIPPSALCALSE